jgi:hypothetical protein
MTRIGTVLPDQQTIPDPRSHGSRSFPQAMQGLGQCGRRMVAIAPFRGVDTFKLFHDIVSFRFDIVSI